MKKSLTYLSILLLLINTIGAFYGSYNLIFFPDGSSFKLPVSLMKLHLFDDFLIPGILLFLSSGIFGSIVLFLIFSKSNKMNYMIIAQGIILVLWITVESFIFQSVERLQILFGSLGLILMICGFVLYKFEQSIQSSVGQFKR